MRQITAKVTGYSRLQFHKLALIVQKNFFFTWYWVSWYLWHGLSYDGCNMKYRTDRATIFNTWIYQKEEITFQKTMGSLFFDGSAKFASQRCASSQRWNKNQQVLVIFVWWSCWRVGLFHWPQCGDSFYKNGGWGVGKMAGSLKNTLCTLWVQSLNPTVVLIQDQHLPWGSQIANKKSHICEEGRAHLRISFWHLLINLKNK